jgi:hypothetical protein
MGFVQAMMCKSEELLEAIAELRRHYPHWRFGQLVGNVAGWADQGVWDVEDEQLLEAARLHLQQLESEVTAKLPS